MDVWESNRGYLIRVSETYQINEGGGWNVVKVGVAMAGISAIPWIIQMPIVLLNYLTYIGILGIPIILLGLVQLMGFWRSYTYRFVCVDSVGSVRFRECGEKEAKMDFKNGATDDWESGKDEDVHSAETVVGKRRPEMLLVLSPASTALIC